MKLLMKYYHISYHLDIKNNGSVFGEILIAARKLEMVKAKEAINKKYGICSAVILSINKVTRKEHNQLIKFFEMNKLDKEEMEK